MASDKPPSYDKELIQRLMKENGTIDVTDTIRSERNSKRIKQDLTSFFKYSSTHQRLREKSPSVFQNQARLICSFLHEKFPLVLEKLISDTMDIQTLFKFIRLLEMIEDGDLDQHEASFQVGLILKDMFINPAIDGKAPTAGTGSTTDVSSNDGSGIATVAEAELKPTHNISYSDFKHM